MHDPKYNWKYYSEPEPYLNNRKLFCPRGKMIGGCSAHNGMVFVRGNRNDYERWENFGLKSWSYEKILPYFKKIETWSGGENQYRGSFGLLPVDQSKNDNPLFKAFLGSASEAGHKINPDMNGEYQEGFGMFDTTIHNGERASITKYYLNPAKSRKNLNIFSNSYVEKIIFDGKKAIGIEVKIKNKVNKIFANAFGKDPEFFSFYRAMIAYEKALIGGDTSLILSPDSDFFKFFGSTGLIKKQ